MPTSRPTTKRDTAERLKRVAEHLFATKGIGGVSAAEIHEKAGAKNASALHYHFGSQQRLLEAIIGDHLDDITIQRNALIDQLEAMGQGGDRAGLIDALVRPLRAKLRTASGRAYIRIVAQLRHQVVVRGGRVGRSVNPSVRRAVEGLDATLPPLPPSVAGERLAIVIDMIASQFGERARTLDDGERPRLDEDTWVANLCAMVASALDAPMPDARG